MDYKTNARDSIKELRDALLECASLDAASNHLLWDFAQCMTILQDAKFCRSVIADAGKPRTVNPLPLAVAVADELSCLCGDWVIKCDVKKRQFLQCPAGALNPGRKCMS